MLDVDVHRAVEQLNHALELFYDGKQYHSALALALTAERCLDFYAQERDTPRGARPAAARASVLQERTIRAGDDAAAACDIASAALLRAVVRYLSISQHYGLRKVPLLDRFLAGAWR